MRARDVEDVVNRFQLTGHPSLARRASGRFRSATGPLPVSGNGSMMKGQDGLRAPCGRHQVEDIEAPRLVSVMQAAVMLGCAPARVRHLVHEGKLAGVNLGGPRSLRVVADSIRAFLQSSQVKPVS
jgi:hypothetical protein